MTSPGDAFYVADGDRFMPTPWTRGPWGPDAQHAGPPGALLGRAIAALEPGPRMRVARFTLEILRPIPLAPLRVQAGVVRPGRRVDLCEATLSEAGDGDGGGGGGLVARATAWRIRPDPEARLDERGMDPLTLPGPGESENPPAYDPGYGRESYFAALDWREARGSFSVPGPAAAWMRMRIPLLEGEEPTPLTRVLVAADSGNGISAELPLGPFLFVNLELTVHLAREPEGEWVCIDARTRFAADGLGVAQSAIWDERGWIGSGAQSLLVARR
jgi:Thioesterase-like superfamily